MVVLATYCVAFEGTPKTSSYSIRKERISTAAGGDIALEAPSRATQRQRAIPKYTPGEFSKTAAMREGVLFWRPSPYAF